MSANDEQKTERGDMAGRLPSLEEQTPGLDTEQVRRTDADAEAFFSQGDSQDLDEMAEATGRGEGADEGEPRDGRQ